MSGDVFFLIIQFLVLLLSLSIHESAHAWTADALGDPTARYLGRVSLNPIVHADPFGTILFPLMGMFLLHRAMFGWEAGAGQCFAAAKANPRSHACGGCGSCQQFAPCPGTTHLSACCED